MKNNFKLITVIVVILIVCAMAVIGYYYMKSQPNGIVDAEKNIKISNNSIENDNIKISVANVSYNGKYLILKYDLNTKKDYSEMFEELKIDDEFELALDRKITLNGEELDTDENYSDQIPYKVSDNEVIIYDVIDVSEKTLSEDISIDVSFFENDITAYEGTDEDYGDNDYEPQEEEEIENEETELENELDLIDPDDYYAQSELREGTEEQEETDEIEEITNEESNESDNEDPGLLEENATADDYEEVQGEYVWDEESEEEQEANEEENMVLMGSIKYECKLSDIEKNITTETIDKEYTSDNLKIDNISVIKTSDNIIIIANSKISDLNYDNIYMQENGDPYSYRIKAFNENNKEIESASKSKIMLTDEEGNSSEDIDSDSTNITAIISTQIVLNNNDTSKLNLKPFYYLEEGNIEFIGDGLNIQF